MSIQTKSSTPGDRMNTLQGGVSTIINMGTNTLNKVLPPDTREDLKTKLANFATEKPYLASFLLSQIAISGFPIFLFIVMTVTVTTFALITGLLIGLLGALFFILGSVGFALVILLPTLFFTTFAAVGIWLWGVGIYYIIKYFNQKEIPGVHKPFNSESKARMEITSNDQSRKIKQIYENGST